MIMLRACACGVLSFFFVGPFCLLSKDYNTDIATSYTITWVLAKQSRGHELNQLSENNENWCRGYRKTKHRNLYAYILHVAADDNSAL